MAHGMLILTSENVTVLGGRVETLAARRESVKASLQRSTLPKEWTDSLGQIDDLPTDTRLEGDAPDANQVGSSLSTSTSPVRPAAPSFLSPIPMQASTNSFYATTTLPPTKFPARMQATSSALSETLPARPTSSSVSSLAFQPRSLQTSTPAASSPSAVTIATTANTVTHTARNPSASASSRMLDDIDDVFEDAMDVDAAAEDQHRGGDSDRNRPLLHPPSVPSTIASTTFGTITTTTPTITNSAASMTTTATTSATSTTTAAPSPSAATETPPAKIDTTIASPSNTRMRLVDIPPAEEEDVPDVVESIDAYIGRIESSQTSQNDDIDTEIGTQEDFEWQEHDMEDLFDNTENHLDNIPESQGLIEPPDAVSSTSNDALPYDGEENGGNGDVRGGVEQDIDFDEDSDLFPYGPRTGSSYAVNPNKRRKLSIEEEEGEEEEVQEESKPIPSFEHAIHHVERSRLTDQKEDELKYMTETEYEAQMERNAEMVLISELQFITNKKRKYKIHATCIASSLLESTNGSLHWTITITDSSNEELYVRVAPNVAAHILGVLSPSADPSELEEQLATSCRRISQAEMLEKVKKALNSDVVLSWDVSDEVWTIVGL